MSNTDPITISDIQLGQDPLSQYISDMDNLGLGVAQASPSRDPGFAQGAINAPISNIDPNEYNQGTFAGMFSEDMKNITLTGNDAEDRARLSETRARNQHAADVWKNGIIKFGGKTLTAIAGATVGSVYGVGSALLNTEANKFYDNSFQRSMDGINKWLDGNLPTYQTKAMQESDWYKQMVGLDEGFASFWADKFLGAASFTAGAILSELAIGAAATATGGLLAPLFAVQTAKNIAQAKKIGQAMKMGAMMDTALDTGKVARAFVTGSMYEAGVEARHYKDEAEKKYLERLGRTDKSQLSKEELKQMNNDINSVANAVFGANSLLVGVGNMVQFGRIFGGSSLSKVADKLGIGSGSRISRDATKEVGKRYGVKDTLLGSKRLDKFYRSYEYPIKMAGSALYEGVVEEGGQSVINKAGLHYIDNKYSGENLDSLNNMIKSTLTGFQDTYWEDENGKNGWEEIFIGMLMGPSTQAVTGAFGNGLKQQIKRSNTALSAYVDMANSAEANNFKAIIDDALTQFKTSEEIDRHIESGDIFLEKNAKMDSLLSTMHTRDSLGLMDEMLDEYIAQIDAIEPENFSKQLGHEEYKEDVINEKKEQLKQRFTKAFEANKKAIKKAKDMFPADRFDTLQFKFQKIAAHTLATHEDSLNRIEEISKSLEIELNYQDVNTAGQNVNRPISRLKLLPIMIGLNEDKLNVIQPKLDALEKSYKELKALKNKENESVTQVKLDAIQKEKDQILSRQKTLLSQLSKYKSLKDFTYGDISIKDDMLDDLADLGDAIIEKIKIQESNSINIDKEEVHKLYVDLIRHGRRLQDSTDMFNKLKSKEAYEEVKDIDDREKELVKQFINKDEGILNKDLKRAYMLATANRLGIRPDEVTEEDVETAKEVEVNEEVLKGETLEWANKVKQVSQDTKDLDSANRNLPLINKLIDQYKNWKRDLYDEFTDETKAEVDRIYKELLAIKKQFLKIKKDARVMQGPTKRTSVFNHLDQMFNVYWNLADNEQAVKAIEELYNNRGDKSFDKVLMENVRIVKENVTGKESIKMFNSVYKDDFEIVTAESLGLPEVSLYIGDVKIGGLTNMRQYKIDGESLDLDKLGSDRDYAKRVIPMLGNRLDIDKHEDIAMYLNNWHKFYNRILSAEQDDIPGTMADKMGLQFSKMIQVATKSLAREGVAVNDRPKIISEQGLKTALTYKYKFKNLDTNKVEEKEVTELVVINGKNINTAEYFTLPLNESGQPILENGKPAWRKLESGTQLQKKQGIIDSIKHLTGSNDNFVLNSKIKVVSSVLGSPVLVSTTMEGLKDEFYDPYETSQYNNIVDLMQKELGNHISNNRDTLFKNVNKVEFPETYMFSFLDGKSIKSISEHTDGNIDYYKLVTEAGEVHFFDKEGNYKPNLDEGSLQLADDKLSLKDLEKGLVERITEYVSGQKSRASLYLNFNPDGRPFISINSGKKNTSVSINMYWNPFINNGLGGFVRTIAKGVKADNIEDNIKVSDIFKEVRETAINNGFTLNEYYTLLWKGKVEKDGQTYETNTPFKDETENKPYSGTDLKRQILARKSKGTEATAPTSLKPGASPFGQKIVQAPKQYKDYSVEAALREIAENEHIQIKNIKRVASLKADEDGVHNFDNLRLDAVPSFNMVARVKDNGTTISKSFNAPYKKNSVAKVANKAAAGKSPFGQKIVNPGDVKAEVKVTETVVEDTDTLGEENKVVEQEVSVFERIKEIIAEEDAELTDDVLIMEYLEAEASHIIINKSDGTYIFDHAQAVKSLSDDLMAAKIDKDEFDLIFNYYKSYQIGLLNKLGYEDAEQKVEDKKGKEEAQASIENTTEEQTEEVEDNINEQIEEAKVLTESSISGNINGLTLEEIKVIMDTHLKGIFLTLYKQKGVTSITAGGITETFVQETDEDPTDEQLEIYEYLKEELEKLNDITGDGASIANRLADQKDEKTEQSIEDSINNLTEILPIKTKDNPKGIIEVTDLVSMTKQAALKGESWGAVKGNLIYLKEGHPEFVEYHEAFHMIFRSFFTDREIDKTFLSAEKLYGKPNAKTLKAFSNKRGYNAYSKERQIELYYEEKIALSLERYLKVKRGLPKDNWLKSLIKKIAAYFKLIKESPVISMEMDAMFERILNGEYKSAKFKHNRFTGINTTVYKPMVYENESISYEDDAGKIIDRNIQRSLPHTLSSMLENTIANEAYRIWSEGGSKLSKTSVRTIRKGIVATMNKYNSDVWGRAIQQIEDTKKRREVMRKIANIIKALNILHADLDADIIESIQDKIGIFSTKAEVIEIEEDLAGEIDEESKIVEDEGDMALVKKSNTQVGGYKSASKRVKKYMNTVVGAINAYGFPQRLWDEIMHSKSDAELSNFIIAADGNRLYNLLVKSLAGVPTHRFLRQLYALRYISSDIEMFYNKWIDDIVRELEEKGHVIPNIDDSFYSNIDLLKESNTFNTVISQLRKDRIFQYDYLADIKEGFGSILNANNRTVATQLFTQWKTAWSGKTVVMEDATKREILKKAQAFFKAEAPKEFFAKAQLSYLGKLDDPVYGKTFNEFIDNTVLALRSIGLDFNPYYVKYSLLSEIIKESFDKEQKIRVEGGLLELHQATLKTMKDSEDYYWYKSFDGINLDTINVNLVHAVMNKAVTAAIEQGTYNIYIEQDKEGKVNRDLGSIGRLKKLADSASVFDPSVIPSVFQNQENKNVYDMIFPSYISEFTNLMQEKQNIDLITQLINGNINPDEAAKLAMSTEGEDKYIFYRVFANRTHAKFYFETLLNNPLIIEFKDDLSLLFNRNFQLAYIGGIRQADLEKSGNNYILKKFGKYVNSEGNTFHHSDKGAKALMALAMFDETTVSGSVKETDGVKMGFYRPGVPSDASTTPMIKLPINDMVEANDLSKKGKEQLSILLNQELSRVRQVQRDVNVIGLIKKDTIVENYHYKTVQVSESFIETAIKLGYRNYYSGDKIEIPVFLEMDEDGNERMFTLDRYNNLDRYKDENNNTIYLTKEDLVMKDTESLKPRGLKLFEFKSLKEVGVDTIELENNARKGNTTLTSIQPKLNEWIDRQVDDYLKMLATKEYNLMYFDKEVQEYVNTKLPKSYHTTKTLQVDPSRQKKDKDGKIVNKNKRVNVVNRFKVKNFFVNDLVMSRSYNLLMFGDPAYTVKNSVDWSKRLKGEIASGPSYITGKTRMYIAKSLEYKVNDSYDEEFNKQVDEKGYTTDVTDAQSQSTVNWYFDNIIAHKGNVLVDEEDPNLSVKGLFQKLEMGHVLTEKESNFLYDMQAETQPNKTVGFDTFSYWKTSVTPIYRSNVSVLNNKSQRAELDGLYKQLFEARDKGNDAIVDYLYKKIHTYWKPVKGREFLHNQLNNLEANNADIFAFDTAIKRNKPDVGTITEDGKDIFNYKDKDGNNKIIIQEIPNRFIREQLKTDGFKTEVIDGTQKIALIFSEQDGNLVVKFEGVEQKLSDVLSLYERLLADRNEKGFTNIFHMLFNQEAEVSEKDYELLMEHLLETAKASGADIQFLELMTYDKEAKRPKFSINDPSIETKVQAMFLSLISKNVLKHKASGAKFGLMSSYGYTPIRKIKKDAEGNTVNYSYVDTNGETVITDLPAVESTITMEQYRENPKAYSGEEYQPIRLRHNVWDAENGVYVSEIMLSERFKHKHNIKKGDIGIEKLLVMHGVRIPTQDKHSMATLKVVDFLPATMGNVLMTPYEHVLLSGEDYDIDSKYVRMKSFFKLKGKETKVGEETITEPPKFVVFGEYAKEEDREKRVGFAYKEFIESLSKNNKKFNKTVSKYKRENKYKDRIAKARALIELGYISLDKATDEYDLVDLVPEARKAFEKKYKDQIHDNWKALNNRGKSIFEYKPLTREEANNILLDIDMLFTRNLGNKEIAATPATMSAFKNLNKELDKLGLVEEQVDWGTSSPLDKARTDTAVFVGAQNIGPAALSNTAHQRLVIGEIVLNEDFGKLFGIYNQFKYKNENGMRINDLLSTVLSAMTDNAKERLAARYNLTLESIPKALTMLMLGVPFDVAMLVIKQPVINMHLNYTEGKNSTLKSEFDVWLSKNYRTSAQTMKYALETIEEDLQYIPKEGLADVEASKDVKVTKENLIEALKFSKNRESSKLTLEEFMSIQRQVANSYLKSEDVSKDISHLSKILSLTKGLKPTFAENYVLEDSLEALGIYPTFIRYASGSNKGMIKDIKFHFTGSKTMNISSILEQPSIKSNIVHYYKLMEVSRKFFLMENEDGKAITKASGGSFRFSISMLRGQARREAVAFFATRALKHRLPIYREYSYLDLMTEDSEHKLNQQVLEMIKKQPNNYLLRFLAFSTSQYKEAKKSYNPFAGYYLHKVVGNTRNIKDADYLQQLSAGFTELYNSGKEGHALAKELVKYLFAKDSFLYRNQSFIKQIAPDFIKINHEIIRDEVLNLFVEAQKIHDKDMTDISKEKKINTLYKKVFGDKYTKTHLEAEFLELFSRYMPNNFMLRTTNFGDEIKKQQKIRESSANITVDKEIAEQFDYNEGSQEYINEAITSQTPLYEKKDKNTMNINMNASMIKKKGHTDYNRKRFFENIDMLLSTGVFGRIVRYDTIEVDGETVVKKKHLPTLPRVIRHKTEDGSKLMRLKHFTIEHEAKSDGPLKGGKVRITVTPYGEIVFAAPANSEQKSKDLVNTFWYKGHKKKVINTPAAEAFLKAKNSNGTFSASYATYEFTTAVATSDALPYSAYIEEQDAFIVDAEARNVSAGIQTATTNATLSGNTYSTAPSYKGDSLLPKDINIKMVIRTPLGENRYTEATFSFKTINQYVNFYIGMAELSATRMSAEDLATAKKVLAEETEAGELKYIKDDTKKKIAISAMLQSKDRAGELLNKELIDHFKTRRRQLKDTIFAKIYKDKFPQSKVSFGGKIVTSEKTSKQVDDHIDNETCNT